LVGFTVAHNTFYGAGDTLLQIDPDPGHQGNLFADNLFVQTGGAALASLGAPASGFSFTHNGWQPSSPGGSLAGPGDVTSTPVFADPGYFVDRDYRLLPGSPELAAGIVVAGVPADRAGTPFAAGLAPDLGAYELAPSPTASPTPSAVAAAPALRFRAWIYPVPVKGPGRLALQLPRPASGIQLRIYTAGFHLALERRLAPAPAGCSTQPLDLSGLPRGAYFARLDWAGQSIELKLWVLR